MNPLDGMAQLYVGLQDRDGNLYGLERDVLPILRKYFRAATLTPSKGMWRGKVEDSVDITIIANLPGAGVAAKQRAWTVFVKKVNTMATSLKRRLRQDAIVVQFVLPGAVQFGLR